MGFLNNDNQDKNKKWQQPTGNVSHKVFSQRAQRIESQHYFLCVLCEPLVSFVVKRLKNNNL